MTDTTVPAGADDTTPARAITPEARAAWEAWWPGVGPWIGSDVDPIDIAHEAFHAGWEAGAARAAAAERQRWLAEAERINDSYEANCHECGSHALLVLRDLLAAQNTPPTTEETR